jgi:hypothetical protein
VFTQQALGHAQALHLLQDREELGYGDEADGAVSDTRVDILLQTPAGLGESGRSSAVRKSSATS